MTTIKRLKVILLLTVIIVFGLLLRYYNFAVWPRHGATFDEYAWTWQGLSLINTGTPVSWSYHPQYNNKRLVKIQGANFFLVKPYLEHPPLFGLVAGTSAYLSGIRTFENVTLDKIRLLSLLMGTLSIFLVFLLTKELYDQKSAILSSALYAFIPTVAIGSRIVQNENFFIPVWLLSLVFLQRYLKNKKMLFLVLVSCLNGLLILAKVPWVTATIGSVFILIYNKKYKLAFISALISLSIGSLYMFYSYKFDWGLFAGLMGLQLNRYDITYTSIYSLFLKPYLFDRFMLDGWIYWGWISFIYLISVDRKKHYFLICCLLAYFLIYFVAIPDEPGHGWYRYPFYPFLIISAGLVIKNYLQTNPFLIFIYLSVVGTSLFGLTWDKTFGFSHTLLRVLIAFWCLSLLPHFINNKFTLSLSKINLYFWTTAYFLMNVWVIYGYNEQ